MVICLSDGESAVKGQDSTEDNENEEEEVGE